MKPDEFENQLRRHPVRDLPAEWREEILSATRAGALAEKRPARRESWLRAIFWPNPAAWAGLAAAWVFIFVFNSAMTDPAEMMAAKSNAGPMDIFMALQRQQQELAQIMQPTESQPAEPPKAPPRPHGDARNRITLV